MKNKKEVFAKFETNAGRKFEMRALPRLIEQRNALIEEIDGLLNTAEAETRALTDEENTKFAELKSQVDAIDKTLKAQAEMRDLEKKKETKTEKDEDAEQRALDAKNFEAFIRGGEETRALNIGNNGGIIPTSIADRIIERVKELSPIYEMAEVYNVGGDLAFPVYDDSEDTGAKVVGDMEAVTDSTGKFTIIKLENYIIGTLKLISKSLIHRSGFDLTGFMINKTAESIAAFLEKSLICGASDKSKQTYEGVFETENLVTAEKENAIGVDELIDVQMTVPQAFQQNACWIMHKSTLKAIRKLKDGDGNYLLNRDIASPFGWTLLGKNVYTTENAPEMAAGVTSLVYGDMSGLYVKFATPIEIEVLREKYSEQYAYGIVGHAEFDSKIVEKQKIAGLKMKAAASSTKTS